MTVVIVPSRGSFLKEKASLCLGHFSAGTTPTVIFSTYVSYNRSCLVSAWDLICCLRYQLLSDVTYLAYHARVHYCVSLYKQPHQSSIAYKMYYQKVLPRQKCVAALPARER